MKKYTVIIKNNESGEVIFEREVNAMIAGLAAEDDVSSILLRGTHEENLVAMNIVQHEFNHMYEAD
jgi:hypothetical protein